MTPAAFFNTILLPSSTALSAIYGVSNTKAARVFLMAVAGHETNWSARRQVPGGEARGYWQFEKNGGVAAVVLDPLTSSILEPFCKSRDIPFDVATIYEAIAWHDTLAYVVARLFTWMDPRPIPVVGDSAGSYQYYLDIWRPGAKLPGSWPALYQQALAVTT